MAKFQGWGFSNFQIQICLSFLVFHQKKTFFFLKTSILLSYQKHFWANSINREEDIIKGKFSHFRGGG